MTVSRPFPAAAQIGVRDPNARRRPAEGTAAWMDQLGHSGGDSRPCLWLTVSIG